MATDNSRFLPWLHSKISARWNTIEPILRCIIMFVVFRSMCYFYRNAFSIVYDENPKGAQMQGLAISFMSIIVALIIGAMAYFKIPRLHNSGGNKPIYILNNFFSAIRYFAKNYLLCTIVVLIIWSLNMEYGWLWNWVEKLNPEMSIEYTPFAAYIATIVADWDSVNGYLCMYLSYTITKSFFSQKLAGQKLSTNQTA